MPKRQAEASPESEAREEAIARVTSALGFRPSSASGASAASVEYAKVYTTTGDAVMRLTAVFSRGPIGLDPAHLEQIVITTMVCFDPDDPRLLDLVPQAARGDVQLLIEMLGRVESVGSVAASMCARCHRVVENYVILDDGTVLCPEPCTPRTASAGGG